MLTADKAVLNEDGKWVEFPTPISYDAPDATTIWLGSMVAMATEGANAGLVVAATATATDVVLGVARARVTATATDRTVAVSRMPGRMLNSSGADEITALDVNAFCYVVDDETVARTSAGVRPVAGRVVGVDVNVIVEFPFNDAGSGSAAAVYNVGHADFTAAALAEVIALGTLPAGRYTVDTVLGTAFSGGGSAAAAVEIGISGNDDIAALSFDVFTGATTDPTPRTSESGVGFVLEASTSVELTLTANVNVVLLDAGALTIRVDRL